MKFHDLATHRLLLCLSAYGFDCLTLLHIFSDMDCRIALCAPTGRAAKRLSESTSHEAKTIHRLLEYGGEDAGGLKFHRDASNLLEENVSMVD